MGEGEGFACQLRVLHRLALTGRAANLISPAVYRPLTEQGCEPNDRDLCHQEKSSPRTLAGMGRCGGETRLQQVLVMAGAR